MSSTKSKTQVSGKEIAPLSMTILFYPADDFKIKWYIDAPDMDMDFFMSLPEMVQQGRGPAHLSMRALHGLLSPGIISKAIKTAESAVFDTLRAGTSSGYC